MINLKYAVKVFILLLLFSSCKNETETVTVNDAPATPIPSEEITPVKSGGSTAKLIAAFIARKKNVQDLLASLNPEEANALYETYKRENDSSLVMLEIAEKNILENYYSYFSDERGNAVSPPDTINKKVNLLKSAGLEYWEIGEGFVEIRTVPGFYNMLFKKYVSNDYKDYIAIMAKDDEELYSADAGIVISFADVGRRVINWEGFIAKYPYSKLTPRAIETYKMYQDGYLFGMDNTSTIEYSNNTIYPENLKEFKTFMATHPKSPTTALIKVLIEARGNKDEINSIVQKEQEKYMDKLIADTTPDYY